MPACDSASCEVYFGFDRKVNWEAVAADRVPTPSTTVAGSPWASRPKRSASSARVYCGFPLTGHSIKKGWWAGAAPPLDSSDLQDLELAAEGELNTLDKAAVVGLLTERYREVDDQRTDRRLPLQRQTRRSAQVTGLEGRVGRINVTDVDEPGHAGRVDVLQEGQRQEHLCRAEGLEGATDRLAIAVVAVAIAVLVGLAARVRAGAVAETGTQGVVLEATDVTHTTGVVVFPERERHLFALRVDQGRVVRVVRVIGVTIVVVRLAIGLAVADLTVEIEHEALADRPIVVGFTEDLVVLHGGTGQCAVDRQRQLAAAGRCPVAVTRVVREAEARRPRVDGLVTDGILVRHQLAWRVNGGVDQVRADAEAGGQRIEVGDRDRQRRLEGLGAVGVVRQVGVAVIQLAVADVVADLYARIRQVRIGVARIDSLVVRAGFRADGEAVTRTQEVVLRDRGRQDDARVLRIAHAEHQRTRRLFLDLRGQVDLVDGARHERLVDVDGLEVTETLQAGLRAVDGALRVPGAFELAHFAAQDLVFRAGIALEDHATHIDPLARLDEERKVGGALVLVQLRHRRHLGEGVADVGEDGLDRVGAGLDGGTVEGIALVDVHQLAQGVFRQDQLAEQVDVGDGIDLAFLHARVDVHGALVRADRHLRGIDTEVGVAAIHVVVAELFQIAGELFAGVLV